MSFILQETLEVKEKQLNACKEGLPSCSGDIGYRVTNEGASISYFHCPKQNKLSIHFFKRLDGGTPHHAAMLALHVAHHKKHLKASLDAEAQHPSVERFLARRGTVVPSRRLGKLFRVK